MPQHNRGIDYEACVCKWFAHPIDPMLPAIRNSIDNLINRHGKDTATEIAWLLRAVNCLDLTALSGDDTHSNVQRLCHKAVHPIDENLLSSLGFNPPKLNCAAVCVYPSQIELCLQTLKRLGATLPVATVTGGFPSGQHPQPFKIKEIEECIEKGATEVDFVVNREFVLRGEWQKLYRELRLNRYACRRVRMKTIIAVGELGSLSNVYKASLIAMAAGTNFIKTSTGKENVNANLLIGKIMTRAIKSYHYETGYRVGFKPAGGIRTAKDVLLWQELIRQDLGEQWLYNDLLRIGASSLLGDIEDTITQAIANEGEKICLPFY